MIVKNRKWMQTVVAAISIVAALGGAVGFYAAEKRGIRDGGAANALIRNAASVLSQAEALGTAGAPYNGERTVTRTTYDEPMFTQGLYDYVDAGRPENQLARDTAALVSDPALQGLDLIGLSYREISDAAARVGSEQLERAQATARRGEIAAAAVFFAGVLTAPYAFVRAAETPANAEEAKQTRSARPRLRHAG